MRSRNFVQFLLLGAALASCGGSGSDSPEPPVTVDPPEPVTSNPPTASLPSLVVGDSGSMLEVRVDASDDLGVTRYSWEQTFGASVALRDMDAETVVVDLPSNDSAVEIGLKVSVFDAQDQVAVATTTVQANPLVEGAEPITFAIPDIERVTPQDDRITLFVSGDLVTPISSSTTNEARLDRASSNFVAITDERGTPLLISYKPASNGAIDISVNTSAVSYVLRSPRFFGLEVVDYEGLASQIAEHTDYAGLVRTLEERLENSPCPMQPACNRLGARYAEQIARDIDIEGMVEGVE